MKKVLCFGELLLRLSPEMDGAWIRKNSMPVFIGGAELNAATALARWGIDVAYATALPSNAMSVEIAEHISSLGIEPRIKYAGERIGCYYLPQGADLKNSGVIYDRANSSFWNLKKGEINWEEILKDVDWFHFSAISPALNSELTEICKDGLEFASAKGITISVDLNFRAKLWQYGKLPVDVMPALVRYCDVIMGNIWAEEKMLGIVLDLKGEEKENYISASEKASSAILQQFSRAKVVANTFRFEAGEGVKYFATLHNGSQMFVSREFNTNYVVDKVGSGDTFMAGLIYGKIKNSGEQEMIDYAAAAAFNKLFIKGDATTSTVEQVLRGEMDHA